MAIKRPIQATLLLAMLCAGSRVADGVKIIGNGARPSVTGSSDYFSGAVQAAAPVWLAAPGAPTPEEVRAVAPALEHYTRNTLMGDLWQRPQLSKRDRCIVTLAALIARNQQAEMAQHLDLALGNGGQTGRDFRTHHSPGVLRRLAERCQWPRRYSRNGRQISHCLSPGCSADTGEHPWPLRRVRPTPALRQKQPVAAARRYPPPWQIASAAPHRQPREQQRSDDRASCHPMRRQA